MPKPNENTTEVYPLGTPVVTPPVSQQQPKQSFNKWESTNFGNSQANEKFRRLMGIRDPAPTVDSGGSNTSRASMTASLEQQYEKARTITHTARGLGLGFAGSQPAEPAPPGGSNDGISFVKK